MVSNVNLHIIYIPKNFYFAKHVCLSCAHGSGRKSNKPGSTSQSWDGDFGPALSAWHLFQAEHVHPRGLWGLQVWPLSGRIHRRWDEL